MNSVVITRDVLVGGRHLAAGTPCRVPEDLSVSEAKALLTLGKAVPADMTREELPHKPKKGKGA